MRLSYGASLLVFAIFALPASANQLDCPSGTMQMNHHDGVSSYAWCEDDAGQKEGSWRNWSGGHLVLAGEYAAGERSGMWRAYHSGGELSLEVPWSNGKRIGLSRGWYSDGSLRSEGRFVDGKREGEVTVYYPSGRTKEISIFRSGVRHGPYREFYSDGSPAHVGRFVDGEESGPWVSYAKSGDIEWQETALKGRRVSAARGAASGDSADVPVRKPDPSSERSVGLRASPQAP